MKKGKIYVIEGTDGSGKKTQTQLLYKKLLELGHNVMTLDFPRYNKPSSDLVKRYLNGEYGTNADEVDPYLSSSFYSIDRFVSFKTEFGEFYNNGGIILLDRYTTSNMVHQGSKIKDIEEKNKYLNWLTHLEYDVYDLPVPDAVFFLSVLPEITIELMKERENKITGEMKKDIHENNVHHLEEAYKNAMYLINKYNWVNIDCTCNGRMREIEDINDSLLKKVSEIM